MSDSSPKLRSPIAAYGPVVIPVVVLGIGLAVLFTLGSSKPPKESILISEMTPPPISRKEMQKRMGYGDPDEARAEAMKLIKSGLLSWYDLKPDEQGRINKLTRGGGRDMYEALVEAERAKNKAQKK